MGVKDSTDARVGNVLKFDGVICIVISQEIRGTGKFGKTVHLKVKSLADARIMEKSIRAEDRVEEVEIHHVKLQYLYRDGDDFYFMNNETYEQAPLSAKAIGKQAVFLKENMEVDAIFIEDKPVSLEFPKIAELKVVSTAPGVKGQSDSTYKDAELENGIKVLVPQFVKEGETVRINTADFSYMDRVTVKTMQSKADPKESSKEKQSFGE